MGRTGGRGEEGRVGSRVTLEVFDGCFYCSVFGQHGFRMVSLSITLFTSLSRHVRSLRRRGARETRRDQLLCFLQQRGYSDECSLKGLERKDRYLDFINIKMHLPLEHEPRNRNRLLRSGSSPTRDKA